MKFKEVPNKYLNCVSRILKKICCCSSFAITKRPILFLIIERSLAVSFYHLKIYRDTSKNKRQRCLNEVVCKKYLFGVLF